MAKSKSTLAVLHAQRHSRPKSKVSANRSNIYEALGLEEPCENFPLLELPLELQELYKYFPLLKLPRELRDRIFEYPAVQQDDVSGFVITVHRVFRDRLVKIGTDPRRLSVRPLSPQRPLDRRPPVLGALALSVASKQMHAEFQDAIARTIPHRVYSHLTDEHTVRNARHFSRDDRQFFPPRIHRLVIQNVYDEAEECCGGDEPEVQSVVDCAQTILCRRLRPCSATLEDVVVDVCQGPGGSRGILNRYRRFETFDVDVLQDTVASFIETLPTVRRYAVRTCRTVSYGRRCKGQAWGDIEVYHEQGFYTMDQVEAHKDAEMTGFFEEMGVKDLYLL